MCSTEYLPKLSSAADLPLACWKPAVADDALDIAAGQADVGERAVVERRQLVNGAANPAFVPDPGNQSFDGLYRRGMPGLRC
jgi:hypothetical protein